MTYFLVKQRVLSLANAVDGWLIRLFIRLFASELCSFGAELAWFIGDWRKFLFLLAVAIHRTLKSA
ncbi:MAG: hypothetical protein HOP36_12690 [Methyloglobulus sp.]|nr:hypothetical protein [Methyloglobulus sp.]